MAHHNPAPSKERLFKPHVTHGWTRCGSPSTLAGGRDPHVCLTPAPSTPVIPDPQFHSLQTWSGEEGWVQNLKAAGRRGSLVGDARSLGRKASDCFGSTASLGLAVIRICSLFQRCWTEHLSPGEIPFPSVSVMTPGHFSQLYRAKAEPRRMHCLISGCKTEPFSLADLFAWPERSPGISSEVGKHIPALWAATAFPAAAFLPLSALQRAWAGAWLCRDHSEI